MSFLNRYQNLPPWLPVLAFIAGPHICIASLLLYHMYNPMEGCIEWRHEFLSNYSIKVPFQNFQSNLVPLAAWTPQIPWLSGLENWNLRYSWVWFCNFFQYFYPLEALLWANIAFLLLYTTKVWGWENHSIRPCVVPIDNNDETSCVFVNSNHFFNWCLHNVINTNSASWASV